MKERLTNLALSCGATKAAALETKQIVLDRSFFDLCKQNGCGMYGKCWMCPPDAGNIETLMQTVRSYKHAVLFQIIRELEDSYDIESMRAAGAEINTLARRIRRETAAFLPDALILGAGGCRACETCTKIQGLPCRSPTQALLSLEACGVDVYQTVKNTALKYINGPDTVTFFGMILYN